ncbi:beta-galactosidase-1-like protein 2 [Bacillus rossius redtenbacheri]|uniref:beta-galactosidase-1-like protein 2 n=1 Tax=Bacillus rossius redtenbacheri TaxID=93214 RepID=UPI002FDEDB04
MGYSVFTILLVTFVSVSSQHTVGERTLPTLYEHYVAGGITSGLVANGRQFLLNGKEIRLMTGSIHYFRVHPDYWRDRLRKLRAGGFNGVTTCISWNLHQPELNSFDFGDGSNDFSPFLNLTKFFKIAQEEDLLVVVRPGPFINAEWEDGGLPSWLYRDSKVKVRSSNPEYISYVTTYYNALLPILKKMQFTEGGPVIAFQIENEFGSVARGQKVKDTKYLEIIRDQMESHGLTALKFTSDSVLSSKDAGSVPGAMMTANLGSQVEASLAMLKELQPEKPLWVMEYWTGWWDHWFDKHHTKPVASYLTYLKQILEFPANFNLYMFHGGTSFGFMNSATMKRTFPTYKSDVSSYDYDAPLSEAGDYTEKYNATVELIANYLTVKTKLPAMPAESVKMAYPSSKISESLSLSELVLLVDEADHVNSTNVKPMELLEVNNQSGQSYGFVLYRKTNVIIPENAVVKINGQINDLAVLMVNGVRKTEVFKDAKQQMSFGYFDANSTAQLALDSASVGGARTLDILVENWGRRANTKGIVSGSVLLNNDTIKNWQIYALQFKGKWLRSLSGWQAVGKMTEPTLFRAVLDIEAPHDTFINMSAWGKGSVFVNGFNAGRYFPAAGPAQTLYVPAPLLNKGRNEILVFELYSAASEITFSKVPILG